MPSDKAKFTLRIERNLIKEFHYVAEYNARSANRELEVLMKRYVEEFKKLHGEIELEQKK